MAMPPSLHCTKFSPETLLPPDSNHWIIEEAGSPDCLTKPLSHINAKKIRKLLHFRAKHLADCLVQANVIRKESRSIIMNTAQEGEHMITSRFGNSLVRPSKILMMPSIKPTGTPISHGFLPANLNRYSPCSLADQAFPGPESKAKVLNKS